LAVDESIAAHDGTMTGRLKTKNKPKARIADRGWPRLGLHQAIVPIIPSSMQMPHYVDIVREGFDADGLELFSDKGISRHGFLPEWSIVAMKRNCQAPDWRLPTAA
jgi:hypothetical protein